MNLLHSEIPENYDTLEMLLIRRVGQNDSRSYDTALPAFFLVTAFALAPSSSAQQTRWLNAGSLQNWYSEIGNEREHGLVTSQQYGLRWPAILEYQDAQAGKAFWIGLQGFDDGENEPFDYKVIHIGPRVQGADHFFPREFALHSRYKVPEVMVEGRRSVYDNTGSQPDVVDPELPSDRMIRIPWKRLWD